jgi:C4-dicarboxylate transporter, DctM subunit
MIGFGLMVHCYFFAPSGMQRPRAPCAEVLQAFKGASLPLLIPVIVLRHSLGLVHTNRSWGRGGLRYSVDRQSLNPRHIRFLAYDFCGAGLIFSLPLITIGAAPRVRLAVRLSARGHRHRRLHR